MMAKSLIRNRHAVTKLYGLKSQLQAISLRIQVRSVCMCVRCCRRKTLPQQCCLLGKRCVPLSPRLPPLHPHSILTTTKHQTPLQLEQTLKSTQAMADAMMGATKAMRVMNRRLNLPNMQKVLMEFEKQNERMEMTSDMMGDAIDDAMEVSESERETPGRRRCCSALHDTHGDPGYRGGDPRLIPGGLRSLAGEGSAIYFS